MEDFIQKQADEIFEAIDKHLIDLYYGRRMEYPPLELILSALDQAYRYPTARNITNFNKLNNVLSSIKFETLNQNKNNEDIDMCLMVGVYFHPDIPPGYFSKAGLINDIVINGLLFDPDLSLEKYVRSILNVDALEEGEFTDFKPKLSNKQRIEDFLRRFGFFQLEKVYKLRFEQQNSLLDILYTEETPFKLAFLHYLGFINYIEKEHFSKRGDMYKALGKIFYVNGDTIKNNLNSLNPNSGCDKTRYTAHLHIKAVEKTYNQLK